VKRRVGLLLALGVVLAVAPAGTASTFATATPNHPAEPQSVTATATLRVIPGRLSIVSITYRVRRNGVLVSVAARNATGLFVSEATVLGLVKRDGRSYVATRAVTGPAGRTTYRIPRPKLGGCLTTTIRRATAAGLLWDGKTPHNRICIPRPR
jgi:hypothetical protein